jgi:hypothetical protein
VCKRLGSPAHSMNDLMLIGAAMARRRCSFLRSVEKQERRFFLTLMFTISSGRVWFLPISFPACDGPSLDRLVHHGVSRMCIARFSKRLKSWLPGTFDSSVLGGASVGERNMGKDMHG